MYNFQPTPNFDNVLFPLFILLILTFSACNQESDSNAISSSPESHFVNVTETSGFDFTNILDEETLKNPFNYINAYIGGGVAIGDINNDGLQDIYITANMSSSKLFLNKGNMQFEDITFSSGTSTTHWSSGVTMADVNQDGWLDIYVCQSYHDDPSLRRNKLFINNKNSTFTEKALSIGVADENYSVGASFFDYDKDGDLDLIVANHPRYRMVSLQTHYNNWLKPNIKFSNRLFRNDGTNFTDVTTDAGILSYGFSLSLTTSDIDTDGYPDIMITVDHDEPDIVFHNNGDGTFSNIVNSALKTSSLSSMGIDAGDLNNDRYPDIVVSEMLSEDHYREKVSMGMQSIDRFNYMTDSLGYKYYQMHNFLYMNNGNNTFSDVSQLAGVHKSDWSWASLLMDYDNDGLQDLYFCNGLYRELFHKDNKHKLDSLMMTLKGDMVKMNNAAHQYSKTAPQAKLQNYLYKNMGDLRFEKYTNKAGLTEKTISTGGAYGDLDNDGDLDLVICNVGEASFVYENKSIHNNYLRVSLDGQNKCAILSARVEATINGVTQYREILGARGFQSSSEPIAHFGLGEVSNVDQLKVTWSDGKSQVISNVKSNQIITVKYNDASLIKERNKMTKSIVYSAASVGIDYIQNENNYSDYDDQILLPHKLSEYGPHIAKGDVNGDGLMDIYISSPLGQPGELYIQDAKGYYKKSSNLVFFKDKEYEDGQALFADIDGDEDLDLIVASTGYEFSEDSDMYQPRLYKNDGQGRFTKVLAAFPNHHYSSSCVVSVDYDDDGDLDLFIGGRLTPKKYPVSGTSALFINDGTGNFENKTKEIAENLASFGMVRDALWTDLNKDGQADLIVIGEWTKIGMFKQEAGKLVDRSDQLLSQDLKGWWNTIESADIDGDGYEDYAIGNLGYNYKYQATQDKPFVVYGKDFDNSGTCDIVLGAYYGDVIYPVRGKNCSSEQIPNLEKKFPSFENFASADLNSVYGSDLDGAVKFEVTEFGSIILYGNAKGTYDVVTMPRKVQTSPINGIVIFDYNKDGKKDLIVAGNLYQSEIETGRADSGTGYIMVNKGDRQFQVLSVLESGIYLPEDVKSLLSLDDNASKVLVGVNKSEAKLISF